MLINFLDNLGSFFKIALPAALTAWGALWTYNKQRELEHLQERFLKQGIDVVTERAGYLLTAHLRNWAKALDLLKLYRDIPQRIPAYIDSVEWIDPENGKFPLDAVSRVNALVNSTLIWDGIQIITAYAGRSHWLCSVEVPLAIQMHAAGELAASRENLVESFSMELKRLHEESDATQEIIGAIQVVARVAEDRVLARKAFKNLRSDPQVILAMAKIKIEVERHRGRQLKPA